ncbi:MAG: SmpA/OmlA protein [Sphingomonas bacterium]|nr:SmpA/OmlA protein [Sphingomonas bacterium]MDB5684810.1 SmpA/OmlA protein [Sphingomonas bacterium]MDB5717044.1 SmpA/OmlA protein [Sphingomonas bacterium]
MSRPAPRLGLAVLAITVALAASGCSRIRDHKGYVVDSTLIGTVQPGIDNRDSVAKTLGRPSFVGQFDDKTWYYVSRETRQFAFASPKPTAQTVLAVQFDAAGNVTSVQRTGLEKVASLSPSGDKTPTLGRERGFFSELFGNIGRVGSVSQGGSTADNPN